MRRHRIVGIAVALMLGGCGAAGTVGPEASPAPAGPSAEETARRLERQAQRALTRYDAAVRAAGGLQLFVPVPGQLNSDIGTLEPANEHYKQILQAGRLEAVTDLPGPPSRTGAVVWKNGERVELPLLSSGEALKRIVADGVGDCGGCTGPVQVTGARLSSRTVVTTKGKATVPAWEFTLKDTSLRVIRVAVDGGTVKVPQPSWDPDRPPAGTPAEAAVVSGRRLTVKFTGSQEGADKPCGADYTAKVYESAYAVVVTVQEHGFTGDLGTPPPGTAFACLAVGYLRTATVSLDAPLNGRAVLEAHQGQPVPVGQ